MSLATLILKLKPLVADPEGSFTDITSLLQRYDDLAEYEVARHYASKYLEPQIWRLASSEDPLERYRAIQGVRQTFSRAAAAKVLRQLAKDPDAQTRSHARATIAEMGLDDVALRDTRVSAPPDYMRGRLVEGRFNPSGWYYGASRRYGGRPARAPGLSDLGLPRIGNVDRLAKWLGYDSAKDLVRLIRPGSARGAPYVDFDIPKATGGTRRISAPRKPLRTAQRRILDDLLAKLPTHEAAHGFVRGRSTVTNAKPHVGAKLVVKMDLKDFFPTVHYRRVRGLFQHYGYNPQVSGMLAALTTRRPVLSDGRVAWPGVLPQGAPTSPALANLVCRRMDSRLSGLCQKTGAVYTRYADDLTFSFQKEPDKGLGHFLWWVDQVCQQEGFTQNAAKRRVLRTKNQQRVTGIVVNSGLSVPRAARRRFRAILHNCRRDGIDAQARGRTDFRDYLQGFAAYVKMVQPDLGTKLVSEVEELLGKDPGPTRTPRAAATPTPTPTATTTVEVTGGPLIATAQELRTALADFPDRAPAGDVQFILNTIDYAWSFHEAYLQLAEQNRQDVEAVLVGLNPSIWGMGQTGVPFGDPTVVRDFFQFEGQVPEPASTHPKRPIRGLESSRKEISGQRVWEGIRDCFGSPASFFERYFVLNYCPLIFLNEKGSNIVPAKLPKDLWQACQDACDAHAVAVLDILQPRTLIGVGKAAAKDLEKLVGRTSLDIPIAPIMSPSPANPAANTGWLEKVREELADLGHAWPEP